MADIKFQGTALIFSSTKDLLENARLVPECVLGRHPDHAPALGRHSAEDGNGVGQTVAVVGYYSPDKRHKNPHQHGVVSVEYLRISLMLKALTAHLAHFHTHQEIDIDS